MNPIYKFELSKDGTNFRRVYPVYKDDLAKDFQLQQNEEFYRASLSGKLTFQSDDYTFINSSAFETEFELHISISYDAGQTWALYWVGRFWKTDCEFNDDDKTIVVQPAVYDEYNDVLAGMEKEYNLIELAPEIERISIKKRPCLQIYIPGAGSVGQIMFGNNTYWETECEPKTFSQIGASHFGDISDQYPVQISFYNTQPPAERVVLYSTTPILDNVNINYGRYRLQISLNSGSSTYDIILTRSDGAQWRDPQAQQPSLATLTAVSGTGAEYQFAHYTTLQSLNVFGRIITDRGNIPGVYELGNDDMVANNRNYHYCLPFNGPDNDLVVLTSNKTTTPTQYGIYQPGIYYDVPSPNGHWIPVARNTWGEYSVWINVEHFQTLNAFDESYSKDYVLKDTYPIWSVISVLLAQFAPGITHSNTVSYSAFLYGLNPISGINQRLFITPKSNVMTSGYDQPAQKAPITLKRVTDMLRDCFRCYWFIDKQNRFRIEHISYFMRGGTYTGQPVIGIDLTQQIVTRNDKPWAFARNQYKFDKPEMASRYQFGWMDDVTELFDGFPIGIVSKYVNPDNIEQINVAQFTSDVDYILLNPSVISEDGFVLLSAILTNGTYSLPMNNLIIDGVNNKLQNGYVSFAYLELTYYGYDMPAKRYIINGVNYIAQGIKKLKNQTLKFPVYTDPDLTRLIKTNMGNGTIEKISINLSSRNANATLKYDTE